MTKLDDIIDSILNPRKEGATGNTLVVQNHLSQLKLFGIRKGIEFLPEQDDNYDTRKKFIDKVCRQNKLELYLNRMWDLMVCKGEFLLYLRPTKEGTYNIYFYSKDNYKAYYNADGDLIEVVIRYSYKVRSTFDNTNNVRWMRLRITSEVIEQTQSEQQPSFEGEWYTSGDNVKTFENTLKFIPCVVVRNSPTGQGEEGIGEFEWLKDQIETLDNAEGSIDSNLEFFGNPSLVSTRSPNELLEAVESDSSNLTRNRTMTSAGGWYSSTQSSTKKQDPFVYRRGGGIRVKRVVGNVQPDERFGYISPDPISPDHIQHVREKREAIHFALGGIDERGISANATAYEMKSIYGRLAATTSKKCIAIYEHGLCKLLEMAIAAEEDLFRLSLATVLKKETAEMTDEFIEVYMQKSKGIPQGVFGLPPLGNRLVKWRFTGPVFEDSPQDIQSKTIAARNYQELGVRSLAALKTVFQDKTDKELQGMLSGGYPFRYMSSVAATTGQMLSLYQQLLQVPDQQNPNQPLAFSIPVSPLINRSFEALYNELNYEPRFDSVQPGDPPEYNTGYSQYSASLLNPSVSNTGNASIPTSIPNTSPGNSISGLSTYPSPLTASGIYPYPYVQGQQQQPVEGSIQQRGFIPEFQSGIPSPGSTISTTSRVNQSQQPVFGSQLQESTAIPGIPPDLAIDADKPGSIWQQLFPNFSAAIPRRKPSSKRSSKK